MGSHNGRSFAGLSPAAHSAAPALPGAGSVLPGGLWPPEKHPCPRHCPMETKAWSPGSPRSPWLEQSPGGRGHLRVECWGVPVPAPLGKGMCPSHSPMHCCKASAAGKSLWRGRNPDGSLESWGGWGQEALSSHGSDGGQRPQLIWERFQYGHCSLPSRLSGPTHGTKLFLHGIITGAGSGAGWPHQY